ncbi:MAG: hypothetical protein U0175_33760 [Caldilineaceae bacterium]
MYWLAWLLVGLIAGWLIEFVIDYRFWQRRSEDCAGELARLRGQIANFEGRALGAEQNEDRSNSKLREANEILSKAQQDLTSSYAIQASLRKNIQVLEDRVDNWGRKIGLLASSEGILSSLGTAFSLDGDDELKSHIVTINSHLRLQPTTTPSVSSASFTPLDQIEAHQPASDPLYTINGIGSVFEQRLNAAGIYTFQQLVDAGAPRLHEIIAPKEWQGVNTLDWITQAQELLTVHK